MAKLPSFQFYPGDWMKDPKLRSVSSGARGLWIDMLCMMFESDPRGYLQTATAQPLSTVQIARMTGNCSLDDAEEWLAELENSGVLSRTQTGVIYSRRLVRDEHIRSVRSEAGLKGSVFGSRGGRPKITAKTAKTANITANTEQSKRQSKGQNNPPSSSSSSSEKENEKEKLDKPLQTGEPCARPDRLDTPTGADETDLAEDEMPILQAFFDYLGNRNQRKQVRSKTVTAIIDKRHQGTAWMLAGIAWAAAQPKKYSHLSFLLNDFEKHERQAAGTTPRAANTPPQTASPISGHAYAVMKRQEFEERCRKQREAGLIK